jgi:hypothetical protein
MVLERKFPICLLHIIRSCLRLQAKHCIWVDSWWTIFFFIFLNLVPFVIIQKWVFAHGLLFTSTVSLASLSIASCHGCILSFVKLRSMRSEVRLP